MGGGDWSEHLGRMQAVQAFGQWDSLSRFVHQTDTIFPPGLHWAMAVVGSQTGHGEAAIGRAMVLWLILTALAVGAVTWRLTRDDRATALTVGATFATPALGAVALTYYFDLPMTAWLWMATAWLLWWRPRIPELAGAGAGVFWFAAAITKWTALPFGVVMLGGALLTHCDGEAWSPREVLKRVRAGAVTGGVMFVLVRWFFSITDVSWRAMSENTMGDPGAWSSRDDLLAGLTGKLQPLSVDRVEAYIVDLGTTIYSPLLAVAVVAGVLAWGIRDRRGLLFVFGTVVGQWAVLFLLVPPADPRFLIPLAPALTYAAVLGLVRLPPRARGIAAALALGVGLAVIADVHHGAPHALNARWSADGDRLHGYLKGRGLSIDSTDQKTGWMRADMGPPPFAPDREAVFAALASCAEADELVVGEGTLLDAGDTTWWQYRVRLAAVRGESDFELIEEVRYRPSELYAVAAVRGAAPRGTWTEAGAVGEVRIYASHAGLCDPG